MWAGCWYNSGDGKLFWIYVFSAETKRIWYRCGSDYANSRIKQVSVDVCDVHRDRDGDWQSVGETCGVEISAPDLGLAEIDGVASEVACSDFLTFNNACAIMEI